MYLTIIQMKLMGMSILEPHPELTTFQATPRIWPLGSLGLPGLL